MSEKKVKNLSDDEIENIIRSLRKHWGSPPKLVPIVRDLIDRAYKEGLEKSSK